MLCVVSFLNICVEDGCKEATKTLKIKAEQTFGSISAALCHCEAWGAAWKFPFCEVTPRADKARLISLSYAKQIFVRAKAFMLKLETNCFAEGCGMLSSHCTGRALYYIWKLFIWKLFIICQYGKQDVGCSDQLALQRAAYFPRSWTRSASGWTQLEEADVSEAQAPSWPVCYRQYLSSLCLMGALPVRELSSKS